MRILLRARLVVPLSAPPIQNGAVLISQNRIAQIGSWKVLAGCKASKIVDFGDAALLPGLVNAHCHLDYTSMAGLAPPQKSFVDWIKLITTAKAHWTYSEFAESWLRGAQMLLRTGTTTVADFEAVPELLPDTWSATPLRVVSFLEMTGVKSRRNPAAILAEAAARIQSLPDGRCRAGLAPHAPYSTVPELLRLSAMTARRKGWPLSIHLAESRQEFEMLTHARGEMFDWLRRNQRDMSDCGLGSPIQHLERCNALGRNLLAVHVNYLHDDDASLLARRHVSIVHCPRSHSYFNHSGFPLRELSRAKINLCLGTDSLASVYKRRRDTVELSLFDEMRAFARAHPGVPLKTILLMATLNGARALGMSGQTGEISKGAFADLIAIPFSGRINRIYDRILEHRGHVIASMIDGQWGFPEL